MRVVTSLVLVVTLAVPTAAIAQSRGHRPPPTQSIPATPPATRPQMGVSLPQSGVPLRQIGLPQPALGLPSSSGGFRTLAPFHSGGFPGAARARNYGAGFGRPFNGRRFIGAPVIFYVPQYVAPFAPSDVAPLAPPLPPASEQLETEMVTGSLVLMVEPATAQVFVDGYGFGTPDAFDGQRGELALEPGPHKVELFAPGYESVTLEVRIIPNQTVKYLNAMKPLAPVSPPAAPGQPKTIYVIPGCYLGDVLPKEAHLPATCDVSRVVTFER